MATKIKESTENPLFEIKSTSVDKNIYQRIVKSKGRSKNELKTIVNQLPTATIHIFSEENFDKLKQIEKELNEKIESRKEIKSLKDIVFTFLEI